ncbi:MAG: hypothetical protein BEN19_00325 [Epulopiscium sp. Nuni2H_MBin003]|nr:MAG: hypothetical protein BEN19_00325 [Epulopiscium sp. Nuni2H_MBin003]
MNVNELYHQILSQGEVTEECEDELCKKYEYTDHGVSNALADLLTYSAGNVVLQIRLASKFYAETKNVQCLTFMLEQIQDAKLPYMVAQNIYRQIVIKFFRDNNYIDYKKDYFYYQKLYNRFIKEVDLSRYAKYTPDENTIVIIVQQFLSHFHAPTARVDSYATILQRYLNKKVILVITQELPKHTEMFVDSAQSNTEDTFNGFREMKLFSGEMILSYQPDNSNYNLYEMLKTIEFIYRQKPELVLIVGERSIIGDICGNFTKVAIDTLSSAIPICMTKNILVDEYMLRDKARRAYFEHKKKNFITKRLPKFNYNKLMIPAIKQEYGVDPDCFAIALVGNRLALELTPEYTKMLKDILKIDSRVHFVIIGEFEKYTYFYNNLDILENSTLLGYQKRLKRALSMCDLYLNPPRQGGGMTAVMALSERVPVVTLPECDVEMNIGSDFTAQLEEYVDIVRKYITDKEFYKYKLKDIEKLVRNNSLAPADTVEQIKYIVDKIEQVPY